MNGSEHRIETDIAPFRDSTKFLYVNQNRDSINLNSLRSEKFFRDRQNVLSNCSENDCIFNRYRNTDNSVTTRFQNDNIFNEASVSSSPSILSKCLNRETTKHPLQHDNNIHIEHDCNKNAHKIDGRIRFEDCINHEEKQHNTGHGRRCSDKTTYCRPIVNLYNQQFLYKTVEKNARLRRLLKEIIKARHKEKETENWNKYIDELKGKHANGVRMKCATPFQHVPEELVTPEIIENFYNTKFMCKQPNFCDLLLQDNYEEQDGKDAGDVYCNSSQRDRLPRCNVFDRTTLCYPTSSQGRIILLERERKRRKAHRVYKSFQNTINEGNECDDVIRIEKNVLGASDQKSSKPKIKINTNTRATSTSLETSVQTDYHMYPLTNNKDITAMLTTKSYELSNKVDTESRNGTVPDNVKVTDDIIQSNSLVCIAEKLDNLICSINKFINEIKTNTCLQNSKWSNRSTKLKSERVNFTRSDSFTVPTKEKDVCGLVDNSSMTTTYSSDINFKNLKHMEDNITKINNILFKEITTKHIVDLKDSCVGKTLIPRSVQISVTIPTKEISTEVTRSLSRANTSREKNVLIEEINPPKGYYSRMAIAVNTDPVSLLALLRISTEGTLRRLLSFVPSIDYYYYLSRLQNPRPKELESHYVCNICGAAFNKPSQLTDHIQTHEMGKTRDCCVCRHILDVPRRRPGLFKCQYCGQRFTRAYCCELHQQSCAKRLGRQHDVASSLMLLR